VIPFGRRYRGARAASGPLVEVGSARGAALGEEVELRSPGEPPRRGVVLETSADATIVQVLEETLGLAPAATELAFTGEVSRVVVGEELLGRTFDGAGRPLDGLPPPIGEALVPSAGAPMNPARRARPSDFVETGISAIDGLNTLVRGQKLPVFSGAGLPALDLAARIVEGARSPRGEPFAVIFVGLGVSHRDARAFLARGEASGAFDHTVVYLNEARDPTIERLLAPRAALAEAEHLAFVHGRDVLVVLADMTPYCEALREIATAREEFPGRRGYPGSMYTDLANLYERAGLLEGKRGSVTQVPILTMPDDDLTHPIPDLTGYVTEGQLVLSRELWRRGVDPPIDILPSLSRLMNAGIGAGRTVPEHRRWADQLYAVYARGRDSRSMAAIVGEAGLAAADRRALEFADRFEREFVGQGSARRDLATTIECGWHLLDTLPAEDLLRIDAAARAARAERSDHPRGAS
jgi:V/A-type H+-transporting ATPase subunit B